MEKLRLRPTEAFTPEELAKRNAVDKRKKIVILLLTLFVALAVVGGVTYVIIAFSHV